MAKVKVGISGLNTLNLLTRASHIQTKMTGNVNFPTPTPSLSDYNDAISALSDAVEAAEGGDKDSIVIRNNREAELREMTNQLGASVQSASGGAEEVILSSGFDVRSNPTPAGPTGQVLNLACTALVMSGSVLLKWKPVARAKSYELELKDLGFEPGSDTAEWKDLSSSGKSRFQANGLASGHAYQFRVRALGPLGYGAWSDLAETRVL